MASLIKMGVNPRLDAMFASRQVVFPSQETCGGLLGANSKVMFGN